MGLNDYRFRHVWSVRTAATRVFDALVDLTRYPVWWPDIRTVTKVDDDTAELTCRATLPYALTFRLHRAVEDAAGGRMRVDMTGDLEGYVQGVVAAHRSVGALLDISQRVVVTKPLLRALAPVARPLFRLNHAPHDATGSARPPCLPHRLTVHSPVQGVHGRPRAGEGFMTGRS